MGRSLSLRLLLSYLLVTLLVLATVDVLSLTYLERTALSERRAALSEQATVVAGASRQYMLKGHDYLEYIAQDMGRLAGTRVIILDARGVVLRDSFYDPSLLNTSLAARPEVGAALEGAYATRLERVDGAGRTLYAAAPIPDDRGRALGAVLVATSVEPLLAELAPVRRVLLTVSLAALLVAAGAGWWLARSLTRPVAALTAAIRAVEAGDLTSRVAVDSQDELGRLAEAFNRMADRLSRLEASRQAFVADAAHELRTPLAGLKALVEPLLSGAVPPGPEQEAFLREIGREVDRLAELAADLLTLSELEAGRPLAPGESDLVVLLGSVRARLTPLAQARAVSIHLDAPAALPAVVDPLKLERAFYNLVHNAIAHSPAGEAVTLSAARQGDWMSVTVADRGPGIPPEELGRIFDRFYRRERSRSRERGGAGLGLSIAREIVEAHGGRIRVESVVGEGTRVVVEIPEGPGTGAAARTGQAGAVTAAGTDGPEAAGDTP
ncbi:signal transduction histidine kinase [Symbiobacterium terraclitae]|uniref:histidine kinase n=2 Tax=Symbiobacterium terraclitae TaxID=557451 RepID=A0ABS4JTQ6_9FIRM|nr:HAMP domain-containing sensor histidine kinase [Symbiobacterium terraclitae]MBP2017839.1 signal transduction histidine kinase [Symbiobacterium terraclitae]